MKRERDLVKILHKWLGPSAPAWESWFLSESRVLSRYSFCLTTSPWVLTSSWPSPSPSPPPCCNTTIITFPRGINLMLDNLCVIVFLGSHGLLQKIQTTLNTEHQHVLVCICNLLDSNSDHEPSCLLKWQCHEIFFDIFLLKRFDLGHR